VQNVLCGVENFKTFLLKVAAVSELDIPDNFSYGDHAVLDLIKFAELRVNECRGKAKRMPKGLKHSSVIKVFAWASIISCTSKSCFVVIYYYYTTTV